MQKEMATLVKMLKYFNSLLENQPLESAQLSLAESIALTISYFETNIAQLMIQIESCNNKDYCKLDHHLSELNFNLRQYICDIERFGMLWIGMWGTYCKFPPENEIFNIKIENFPRDVLMIATFKRLLQIINRLNMLDGTKIIYKRQLDELSDEISLYPKINEKLQEYITAVVGRDKNDKESTVGYFLYINSKIQDYLCLLQSIQEALQKILEKYSDKADKLNCIE